MKQNENLRLCPGDGRQIDKVGLSGKSITCKVLTSGESLVKSGEFLVNRY